MADGHPSSASDMMNLKFEVFGKVQGVFFRKYTCQTAQRLGLVGWVKNTSRGTVQGEAEGPASAIKEMRHWLETKGSPSSKIDRAEFSTGEATNRLGSEFTVARGR